MASSPPQPFNSSCNPGPDYPCDPNFANKVFADQTSSTFWSLLWHNDTYSGSWGGVEIDADGQISAMTSRTGTSAGLTFCIGGSGQQHACVLQGSGSMCAVIDWTRSQATPCANPLLTQSRIARSVGFWTMCCDSNSCGWSLETIKDTYYTEATCGGGKDLWLCVIDESSVECVRVGATYNQDAICSGHFAEQVSGSSISSSPASTSTPLSSSTSTSSGAQQPTSEATSSGTSVSSQPQPNQVTSGSPTPTRNSTNTNTPTDSNKSQGQNHTGIIVGITVSVGTLALLAGLIWYIWSRKRRMASTYSPPSQISKRPIMAPHSTQAANQTSVMEIHGSSFTNVEGNSYQTTIHNYNFIQ